MERFPQMLYRWGGPEEIHGGMFSSLVVDHIDAYENAVADGWHPTTDAARAAHEAAQQQQQAGADLAAEVAALFADGKSPDRQELEAVATKAEVPFSPRVSDKKLAEAIKAKVGA